MSRSSFHSALAALTGALRNPRAAIDLASIMVGVLVIGIIGGIASVAVFAVIPWAQNEAAKAEVTSVIVAEGIAQVKYEKYLPMTGLVDEELLPESGRLNVGVNASGTCFLAVANSDSGALFFGSERSRTPFTMSATAVPECIDKAQLDAIVASVGGWPADGGTDSEAPPAEAPAIISAVLPAGEVGTAYTTPVEASGSPTFSATGLPAGLTIAGSGVISGTPTARGTSNVSITAANAGGSVTRAFALLIDGPVDTELLVNGGFEDGFTGWTFLAGITPVADSIAPHSGSKSLRVQPDTYFSQNTPVVGGETLKISAAMQSADWVGIELRFFDASAVQVGATTTILANHTSGWKTDTRTVTAPAESVSIGLFVFTAGAESAIDSVSVVGQRIG